MVYLTDFINQLPQLLGIFMLMLSTFLIGYFSAWWFQKLKYKSLVARLKKEVNDSLMQKNINDIDTIFTEIKPKIIEVVKNAQKEIYVTSSAQDAAIKARTSFVTYNKSKPELDFDSFGYADKSNRDDLTRIKGVGPYIEEKLNEIGIYNYDQIRKLKESDIRIITDLIDFFPGRIERDDWVGQAEMLINQ
jgi:predicted flap endonuclease-1-like 5' DNA nuclease